MSGSKILLIAPYNPSGLRIGQFLAPPLGIYRISSFIEKFTNTICRVYDPNLSGITKLKEIVKTNDFKFIGFSVLHTTLENDIKLIFKLHELSPCSILIAGGQGAVFNSKILLLHTPIKIIVRGFGELSLIRMLKQFNKEKPLKQFISIPGLTMKTAEKSIISTPVKAPYTLKDFHNISLSLNFKKIPYEKYWDYMKRIYTTQDLVIMKNENLLYTIRLFTTSHCPVGCIFCSSTNFLDGMGAKKHPVLLLSPKDVIILIKKAIRSHPNVTSFFFNDDNFLLNTNRVYQICNRIKAEPSFDKLSFFCLGRVDNIDPIILNKMKKSNFKLIIYGVESFSNSILYHIQKKIKSKNPSEKTKRSIIQTLDAGITPLINLILFYPTARIKDIVYTIDNAVVLIGKGARATVYTYVEAYSGSEIINQKFDIKYKLFKVPNLDFEFKIPDFVLPQNKGVRDLASAFVHQKPEALEKIKIRYNLPKRLPQPIDSLLIFYIIYNLLGLSVNKIENTIEAILNTAK